MALRIFGLAFVATQPTSATAEQSYPWCAQGDNILHCYYMTREQCEAAVNYHGFCVANSNAPTPNNEGGSGLYEGVGEYDFRASAAAKLLTKDEARRIAANIVKLTELLKKP